MSVELNGRVTGEGKPLILLHGLFGSADNLGAVARGLEAGWQIHALDLRNHGGSPHADAMDYPSMAEDVLAYMDRQSLDRVAVLGHSMGGKVAMQLALAAGDRVERIIVADIAPVTYEPRHDAILEGLTSLDLKTVKSRKDADGQLAEQVETPAVRQFLLKNLERVPKDEQQANGPLFRWRLNLPVIERCYSQLAAAPEGTRFDGPVLFIKGEDSAYIQEKHREKINALFPSAQVKIMKGAGHWLHAEKTETFVALCRRFLQD